MSDNTPKFALTIRDPWAQAIIHGGKRIEKRTWKPPEKVIGERVAIHCGKTVDEKCAGMGRIDLSLIGYGGEDE